MRRAMSRDDCPPSVSVWTSIRRRRLGEEARLDADPGNRMRDVRLFESPDLVLAQRQRLGRERVLDMTELCRAHDRRRYAGFVEEPRERDLRLRDAALGRHVAETLDDRK